MHRRVIVTLAALAVILSNPSARATEHITITVSGNGTYGAGFGELTPGAHDLTITAQAAQGLYIFMPDVWDVTGSSLWDVHWQTSSETRIDYKVFGVMEDQIGWIFAFGDVSDDPGYVWYEPYEIKVANCLWGSNFFEEGEWHEAEIGVGIWAATSITVHHGLSGEVTILGAGGGLEVLNADGTPFTSAYVTGSGVHSGPYP